jgi:hypothetical protein
MKRHMAGCARATDRAALMNLRHLLSLLLLALCGCSPSGYVPRDTDGGDDGSGERASALRKPSLDELRGLRKLATAIVIGVVDERVETKGQVSYRVRVREILSKRPGLASGPAFEVAPDKTLKVDAFLFREEANADQNEIGRLGELDRYVFFLAARPEKPGEWFNLDDAAGYPLPEAQETVERLRKLAETEPLDAGEKKTKTAGEPKDGAGAPGSLGAGK